MNKDEMKLRTKQYALRIIKLVEKLPKTKTSEVIGRQLLRSGTSVGAKMGTVEEEADESIYWLELLVETGLINLGEISDLLDEGNQIVAITISSIRTTKKNKS